MFICGECKEQVGPRHVRHLVTVETREVTYKKQYNANGDCTDHGGNGNETVREIGVCESCKNKYEAKQSHAKWKVDLTETWRAK